LYIKRVKTPDNTEGSLLLERAPSVCELKIKVDPEFSRYNYLILGASTIPILSISPPIKD
jgi:hypothetical protein